MKSFTYIIACSLCALFFLAQCSDKQCDTTHDEYITTDSVSNSLTQKNTELKKGSYSNARIHVNYFGNFIENQWTLYTLICPLIYISFLMPTPFS